MLEAMALLAALIPATAQAGNALPKVQFREFAPKRGECGLTRATLVAAQASFHNAFGSTSESANSDMGLFLDVSDASCARDYAVAQWIRGCVYSADYDVTTQATHRRYGMARDWRGSSIAFRHAGWQIDSMNVDPAYWGETATDDPRDPARVKYYETPLKRLSWTGLAADGPAAAAVFENTNLFTQLGPAGNPRVPQVFITDHPTGASWNVYPFAPRTEFATDVSLEFQTCVYHIGDLPLKGDPARFDAPSGSPGAPLACFPWQSKARWNFESRRFESFEGIDPFCATEPR